MAEDRGWREGPSAAKCYGHQPSRRSAVAGWIEHVKLMNLSFGGFLSHGGTPNHPF